MARRRYSYEEMHRTVEGVEQKRCTKCRKWKDESKFPRNAKGQDGLHCWCKECFHKYYRRNSKPARRRYTYEESHRVVGGVKEKRCLKCKKWKAESDFYRESQYKDGLQGKCKKCADRATKESRKKRRWL